MAAYILVDNRILDQEDFNEYIEKIPQVLASHGGRYLARGGATRVVEELPTAVDLVSSGRV